MYRPYLCQLLENTTYFAVCEQQRHRSVCASRRLICAVVVLCLERVINICDASKCKRCDVVENEFHFLFECPLYSELRTQYLDCYFYEHPNNFKLRQLFNSTREKQATDLSIFIYKAFTLRNVTLY